MTKSSKRDKIIHTALELIAEYGFHCAPMALIADRADVGTGTIYRYFESKDELITELYRVIEDKMYPIILDGYPCEAPIRVRFIHLWTAVMRYYIRFPQDFRYLEQFRNSPYGIACRRDKIFGNTVGEHRVFFELFEEGVTKQVMKDLPLVMLLALSSGPLLTVTRDYILGFIQLDKVMIDLTIEACWDAVKR